MKEPTAEQILRSMRRLHRKYVRTCQRKNVYFDLTVEQFHKLTSSPCEYCGKPPAQISRFYHYNGIDRKNSKQGYFLSNCATACKECNFIKGSTLTFEEMKVVGAALVDYRRRNSRATAE